MAAPNLQDPTTVTGKTTPYAVTNSLAAALSNSAASGKALRVHTIRACNVTGSDGTVSVTHRRSGTDRYLCNAAQVVANGTLLILDRNEPVWLEEGDDLRAVANANTTIELIISYEDIS
jgi:hypothetical protein